MIKNTNTTGPGAVTIRSVNGKDYETKRSKTCTNHSAGMALMQQVEVGHGQ